MKLSKTTTKKVTYLGEDPGFQVRGEDFTKLHRAEGVTKIFGVFRVKNHDFPPKNHIFSNFKGGARRLRPPLPGAAPAINAGSCAIDVIT